MVICVIYRSRTISRRYREPLRSHQHTAQVVVRRCCCSSNDDAVAGLSSSSRIHDRFGLRKDGTFRVRRVVIQEENKNIINTHTKVSTVLVSFEKRWLVKSHHVDSPKRQLLSYPPSLSAVMEVSQTLSYETHYQVLHSTAYGEEKKTRKNAVDHKLISGRVLTG